MFPVLDLFQLLCFFFRLFYNLCCFQPYLILHQKQPLEKPSSSNIDIQISISNSIQIKNIKLNGEIFSHWSQSVHMYIHGRGKIGYITGEVTAPAINDPKYAICEAEHEKFGIIFLYFLFCEPIYIDNNI